MRNLNELSNFEQQRLFIDAIQERHDDDAKFCRAIILTKEQMEDWDTDRCFFQSFFAGKGKDLIRKRREENIKHTLQDDADFYNCYLSLASFQKEKEKYIRSEKNIKAIGTMYLDIDIHKLEDQDAFDDCVSQVWIKLDELVGKGVLLRPSMITFSGRGFGIYYCLKNVIDRSRKDEIFMYFKLYYAIYDLFIKTIGSVSNVHMDTSVIEAARVARIPGTINKNSGTYCRLVEYNTDSNDRLLRYELNDLYEWSRNRIDQNIVLKAEEKINKIYGISKCRNKKINKKEKTIKKAPKSNDSKRQIEINEDYMNNYIFLSKFIENVVEDMGDQFDHEGTGRQKLVCAYYSYQKVVNKALAYDKANDLNIKFALPLTETEFEAVIKGVDENQPYLYCKKNLIENTIITYEDADRLGLYYYDNLKQNYDQKRIQRNKRNELILKLHINEGLSLSKLTRKLYDEYGIKCSRTNVYKIIENIKKYEKNNFDPNTF